jgi:hypothetical protein
MLRACCLENLQVVCNVEKVCIQEYYRAWSWTAYVVARPYPNTNLPNLRRICLLRRVFNLANRFPVFVRGQGVVIGKEAEPTIRALRFE